MLKKRILEELCVLFAISVLLVVTGFAVVGDSLFFQSDFFSIYMVLGVLSSSLFAVLALLVLGVAFFSRRFRRSLSFLSDCALADLVLAGFVFFLLWDLDERFRIFGLFRKLHAGFMFGMLWLLLVVGAWFLVARAKTREAIARRTGLVALVTVPPALGLWVGLIG